MARQTQKIRFSGTDTVTNSRQDLTLTTLGEDMTLYRVIFTLAIQELLEAGASDRMRWMITVSPSGTSLVGADWSAIDTNFSDASAECILASGCFIATGETTFHPYVVIEKDIKIMRKLQTNDAILLQTFGSAASDCEVAIDGIFFFKQV